MPIRAAILSCLLILTTLPAAALPENGSCEPAPSETLEQLKTRRVTLEQEVKALLEKSQNGVRLSKSQEELLKVIFQINCLTQKPKVARAPAPSQEPAVRLEKKEQALGGARPERDDSQPEPLKRREEARRLSDEEAAAALSADKSAASQQSASKAEQSELAKPAPPPAHSRTRSVAPATRGGRPAEALAPSPAGAQTGGAAKPSDVVEITTYYATNRKPTGQAEPAAYYGSDSDVAFHYGRATVTIPPTHTAGNLELPTLWKLERSPDANKHFVLKAVAPLTGDAMRQELTAKLAGMKKKPLLLFVHGYNVSFRDAALRTAQMSYDLKFPGVAMFYSWPSAGSIFGYLHDEEATILSEVVFESLLKDLAKLPFTDIYIVAHSMGNRIVSQAIEANAGKLPNLRELLLAAPDINADVFRAVIAPKLAALQKSNKTRTTIYASSSDVALQASKVVHGYRRVGETSGGVFTYPGIETIDASSASSMLRDYGHGYLVDSESVLKDMASIILLRATEQSRGLNKAGTAAAGAYWLLP